MKKLFCLMAMALILSMGVAQAQAANYPTRAVNCIVAFAPGGIADITARILGEALQREFGQPIVIVNRGGGGGIPGTTSALRSDPDGYTLLGGAPGNAFTATVFSEAPRFDLDAISFVGAYLFQDRVVMTLPNKPYKTWQELVAYAKANPGKVSVGSGASQEAMEAFRAAAIKDGLDMKFVMYKSGGEVATDLLGGHIDVIEAGVGSPAFQAARKGEVIILANLGYEEKVPFFDNIPRLTDLGYPFAASLVYGYALPDKTPEPIRLRWEQALAKVVQDPEVVEKMENIGLRMSFMKGADYREFSRKVIADTDIMLEFIKKNTK